MFSGQTLPGQRRNGKKNTLWDDRFPARRLVRSFGALCKLHCLFRPGPTGVWGNICSCFRLSHSHAAQVRARVRPDKAIIHKGSPRDCFRYRESDAAPPHGTRSPDWAKPPVLALNLPGRCRARHNPEPRSEV